ncbi:polysaccharide biosynthesis tyrosine autokinase [Pseudomonas sp. CF161]|uniref:polysaccharide biosynthesis tyrosine autokinase n=1 Tax=Pseudomonas sp. CF161 TaxID=911241 RepID=UPI000354FE81|nr:polysaccharide biosynthesis tyrosine autokinase [Pseudomonas sp. CF161]EPL03841.1 lipopolysaccharide biosynthesis [Pseudomonas sp. CF161]
MQHVPVVNGRADDNDEIDVLGLLAALLDHKWLIVGVSGAFMCIGVAYALLATPVFQASAMLQIEVRRNDPLGLAQAGGVADSEPPSATEMVLIQSRSVVGQAVDKLQLDIVSRPLYWPLVGPYLARRFGLNNPGQLAEPRLGLDSFAWGGELLEILELQVPDALRGRKMILTAGEQGQFSLTDEQGREQLAGAVGERLEGNGFAIQVERLRARPGTRFEVLRNTRLTSILQYQEALEVSEHGKDSGMIVLSLDSDDPFRAIRILDEIAAIYVRQNVERSSGEAAHSLAFIKEQLPLVKSELATSGNALNAYQRRSKLVDVTLETRALLEQMVRLDTSLLELKQQQAEMDRKFTRQHPAYRSLLNQIGALSRQQQSLAAKVQALPATQQELLNLTRDVEVGTAIYTRLLNKSQELDVVRGGTFGNARLIDPAEVNFLKPIKPKKPLIVLVATLLGGFLAVALVLVRKAMSRGLESPAAIEQLGLAVYASIPYSRAQQQYEKKRSRSRALTAPQGALLAITHPGDPAVEALRSLRTSLHFAMPQAADNRVMIFGPGAGVGKTFISVNLAVVMARTGLRVLLIDVDMRRGYLHEVLALEVDNGLADVLARRCEVDSTIRGTGVDNVDFISRGQLAPNPSELLMHVSFAALLQQMSARYDLVLLDTPPLLAVTDAVIVGRQCATNLLVTRFALSAAKDIELTLCRLEQNGVPIKGAIFNGVRKKVSRKSGYNAGGYYSFAQANV